MKFSKKSDYFLISGKRGPALSFSIIKQTMQATIKPPPFQPVRSLVKVCLPKTSAEIGMLIGGKELL